MKIIAIAAVIIVALLHLGFLTLEMFFWDHPVGREVFSMTAEQSFFSSTLAANQGLYNGFLAAGLIWGVIAKKRDIIFFVLCCVVIAGLYGAATAAPAILIVQSLPAVIAFILILRTKEFP